MNHPQDSRKKPVDSPLQKQLQHTKYRDRTRQNKKTQEKIIWFPIVLVIASAIVLCTPFAIRYLGHNPLLIGSESARTLSQVHQARFSSWPLVDPLHPPYFDHASPGMGFTVRLLHLTNLPDQILLLLPILLGMVNALMFYVLARKILSQTQAMIASTLFIISPLVITAHTQLSIIAPIMFLFLLAAYAVVENRYGWASLLISIIALEEVWFGICAAIALISFMTWRTEGNQKKLQLIAPVGIVVFFIACIFVFFQPYPSPAFGILTSAFLADLGSPYGLSISFILLALIGAILVWKSTGPTLPQVISYISIIICFAYEPMRIVLFPLITILAALGISFLASRKWALDSMKQFTLLLIACTLFFSLTTHLSLRTNELPTQIIAQEFSELSPAISQDQPVLIQPALGAYLAYYAHVQPFTDDNAQKRGDPRWSETQKVLMSRNAQTTRRGFEEQHVTTLVLDQELINFLQENKQGVLFLIQSSSLFEPRIILNQTKVYSLRPQDTAELG
jgi:hypothetical protein